MSSDLHLCVARNPVTLYNQLTAASAPARPPLRYLILTGGTPRVARDCYVCVSKLCCWQKKSDLHPTW